MRKNQAREPLSAFEAGCFYKQLLQAQLFLILQRAHAREAAKVLPEGRRAHVHTLGEFAAQFPPSHVCTVPATEIALKLVGRPLPNAVLLGGFAARRSDIDVLVVCEHPMTADEQAAAQKLTDKANGVYGICLRGKAGWGKRSVSQAMTE